MNKAFTMVELVFIIVIIGILTAIAIPRFTAGRDDAESSVSAMNLSKHVSNAGAQYTSKENFDSLPTVITCFRLTYEKSGGKLEVVESNDYDYCSDAHVIANKNNLLGMHIFGGTNTKL